MGAILLMGAIVGQPILTACSPVHDEVDPTTTAAVAVVPTPSDPAASGVTRNVMAQLAAPGGLILGQEEEDVSSVRVNGLDRTSSDFATLGSAPPALVSYELSHLHKASKTMFDREAFRGGASKLRELVREKRRRGVLVSLVWHMRCPKASASDPDRYRPDDCPAYKLEEFLPRKQNGQVGALSGEWHAMLDELAAMLATFVDDAGKTIPVQLRPFHEFTGDWFWWGRQNDPRTYRAVWIDMVERVRARGAHQALWVFCPDKPTDAWQVSRGGDFEAYYPGDRHVDVIGFDRYDAHDGTFAAGYAADLLRIGAFAEAHHKIAAVTEVGLDLGRHGVGADPSWFTRAMAAPLLETPAGRRFSYVALWRNAPWEKYVPEPGDGAVAEDFRTMTRDPRLVLDDDRRDLYAPVAASSGGPSG